MKKPTQSRREIVRYLEHARELFRRLNSICLCCSKMFVVQDKGHWQCYFCASDNKSSWKCSKQHDDLNVQWHLVALQKIILDKLEKDVFEIVKDELFSLQNVKSRYLRFVKEHCVVVLALKPSAHYVETNCDCVDCALIKLPFTVLDQRLQRLTILGYKLVTESA